MSYELPLSQLSRNTRDLAHPERGHRRLGPMDQAEAVHAELGALARYEDVR